LATRQPASQSYQSVSQSTARHSHPHRIGSACSCVCCHPPLSKTPAPPPAAATPRSDVHPSADLFSVHARMPVHSHALDDRALPWLIGTIGWRTAGALPSHPAPLALLQRRSAARLPDRSREAHTPTSLWRSGWMQEQVARSLPQLASGCSSRNVERTGLGALVASTRTGPDPSDTRTNLLTRQRVSRGHAPPPPPPPPGAGRLRRNLFRRQRVAGERGRSAGLRSSARRCLPSRSTAPLILKNSIKNTYLPLRIRI